jgi:hypothetical protein
LWKSTISKSKSSNDDTLPVTTQTITIETANEMKDYP